MILVALIVASCIVGPFASPQEVAPASVPEAAFAPALAPAAIPNVRLTRVFAKTVLKRPVQVVARPDRNDRLYVVEQAGRIIEIDSADPLNAGRVVVDLSKGPVYDKFNEQGLLSLAFHPKFAQNHLTYIWYTAKKAGDKPDRNVLASLTAKEDGTFDASSLTVLLEVTDPAWNHNGGTVLFGADGFLYLSTGDGGAGNDPWGNGQSLKSLLAKVLRIDVDHPADGKPYGIPSDNPFIATSDAAKEIYAYGLRNVWRMSFDRKTGELYAGDVGQNAFEEIDVVVKGGNYGWRPREGLQATDGVPDASEASERFLDPLVQYPRKDGVSVTGGYVSRGSSAPTLDGVYLYADYAYGTMWGVRAVGGKVVTAPRVVGGKRGFLPASFGESNDGDLFVCGTDGGADGTGMILRITAEK